MNITRALALVVLVLALFCGACGTGNRLDTILDGPGGGQYIALISQFDSGIWPLADGVLDPRDADNNAADMFVPDQDVVPSFHIQNATDIATADPTYDTDGNLVPDFIVITMRAMAAQAAANVTAIGPGAANTAWDQSDYLPLLGLSPAAVLALVDGQQYNLVDTDLFYKVGGCAIMPLDATLDKPAEIWLPISTATDGTLSLYKWVDGTQMGRGVSADSPGDIGTGTGVWVRLDTTLEQPSGSFAVNFSIDSFGQYAVVSDSVSGSGTGNAPPVITAHTYDQATSTLSVSVSNAETEDVTVSVSSPTGLTPDAASKTVTGGTGTVTFTWDGADGTTGDTTISASDGVNPAVTATQTITVGPVNNPPTITAHTFDEDTAVLSVTVSDAENDDVIVGVTSPTGLTPDATTKTVTDGNGTVTFTWTGANGTTGETTISADDGVNDPVTATQAIGIGAINDPPVIVSHLYDQGTRTLTVAVTDDESEDVVVTVTAPTGLTPDALTKTVTGGNGSAVFTWTADAPATGGTGDTTISADDGTNDPVTATQAITVPPNAAPSIVTHPYDAATNTLTVTVSDADNDDVAVTVTVPTGLAVDNTTQTVTDGNGDAVFHWSAVDIIAGGSGDTTISADDGNNTPPTATQAITQAALTGTFNADTLYAYPMATSVAVDTPVTVIILTGTPATGLSFATMIGLTVETAGTYVADSFNIGAPGGERTTTDGYWNLVGPPAPANEAYLDLGDALLPGTATDIGGGLHRYSFGVVPQGPFTAPTTLPSGAAALCNFQLTFSTAGTYHLGFQLNDGSFDQTYYGDFDGNFVHWGTLDNAATITVN